MADNPTYVYGVPPPTPEEFDADAWRKIIKDSEKTAKFLPMPPPVPHTPRQALFNILETLTSLPEEERERVLASVNKWFQEEP